MCVQEAVARVWLFKQTATAYEAGRPTADGKPKTFEIGDVWDAIRTLRPTREMILSAWSHSLEYSVGTSSHGGNVMDAICERLGFNIDNVFRKMYDKKATQLMPNAYGDGGEMESYMYGVAHDLPGGSRVPLGAKAEELDELCQQLSKRRTACAEFRSKAIGAGDKEGTPLQAIQAVAGDADKRFSGALFPSIRTVACYYKSKAVLRWAAGYSIDKKELERQGSVGGTGLPFKLKNGRRVGAPADGADGDGGAKEHDFAWLVLSEASNKDNTGASWRACSAILQKSKMCSLFDMHSAGIADAVYMLASNENKRPCPEMPSRLPFHTTQTQAFRDEKGSAFHRLSVEILPTPWATNGGNVPAHQGEPIDCRPIHDVNHASKVPIHAQIDLLHNRGRLPALMPHTSTRVENAAPVRWQAGSGIEVNATIVYEHVMHKMEGILRCARVPGLAGLQENFLSGGSAPLCLRVDATGGVPLETLNQATRVLPYSIDVQQMAWTIELAERFYNTKKTKHVTGFNYKLIANGMLDATKDGPRPLTKDGPQPLTVADLPELTLRYPGFPKRGGEPTLRLISVPVGDKAPAEEAKKVEISKANPLQSMHAELLRYQTEVAIGRVATLSDIEEHRRSLIGSGYVWGVTGDVFDYDTWSSHLCSSLIGRGNVDPEDDLVTGGFVDRAFDSVMDAELMLDVRFVERRAAAGELPEAKYAVSMPSGSTYRYQEAHQCAASSRITGGKRAANSAPCQMAGKRTGSDKMDGRFDQYMPCVTELHSPSLGNGSPSLRRGSNSGASSSSSASALGRANSNDDD